VLNAALDRFARDGIKRTSVTASAGNVRRLHPEPLAELISRFVHSLLLTPALALADDDPLGHLHRVQGAEQPVGAGLA